MRLVSTSRLPENACLARDVEHGAEGTVPLLRAGVSLSARYRSLLVDAGIHAVYIDDELGEGINVPQAVHHATRMEAGKALSKAFSDIRRTAHEPDSLPEKTVFALEDVVSKIVEELAGAEDAAVALGDLRAADAFTFQHSIDVTVVGLLIARRLFRLNGYTDYRGQRSWRRIDEHLTQLGLGLILHDIGKLAIPNEIIHKPGPLNDREWAVMKRHPEIGVDLLAGSHIGALATCVVRSHHERWNGSGYPRGTIGTSIPQLARIAAVADVFDAITSERPYAAAAPQHVGVEAILEGDGTLYDSEVVEHFSKVVVPYPPGNEIVLADGRTGIVASVPTDHPHLPVVRLAVDGDGQPCAPFELQLVMRPELAPGPRIAASAA